MPVRWDVFAAWEQQVDREAYLWKAGKMDNKNKGRNGIKLP